MKNNDGKKLSLSPTIIGLASWNSFSRCRKPLSLLIGLTLCAFAGSGPSTAAEPMSDQEAARDAADSDEQPPTPAAGNQPTSPASSDKTDFQAKAGDTAGPPTGLWERSSLFGDIGGVRPWLGNYGITFSLQETSEYLRNLSGGSSRDGAYDGSTQASLQLDTGKAFGLPGGLFNVSGLQIHGHNLSQHTLMTLQSASGIEADATTRLWELWYQRSVLDGKLDVKVGQQSLDQEFMVSQYANSFMNLTFGWPILPSVDLPAGGPAYPLSSLGVRVRAKPTDSLTVLAGVFDGNPAGGDVGDPQKLNRHGTNFNLHSGALFIAEAQYAINQPAANPADPQPSGMPGTYKVGFWYNTQISLTCSAIHWIYRWQAQIRLESARLIEATTAFMRSLIKWSGGPARIVLNRWAYMRG